MKQIYYEKGMSYGGTPCYYFYYKTKSRFLGLEQKTYILKQDVKPIFDKSGDDIYKLTVKSFYGSEDELKETVMNLNHIMRDKDVL